MIPHLHLDRYNGKRVYTFNVSVSQSGIDWQCRTAVRVVAHTATDAVNYIRDAIAPAVKYPTEIETTGPAGGVVHRVIGWESMTWARLCNLDRNQLEIPL